MLKCYGYFYDIIKQMVNYEKLSVNVINISGSRKSGKSYAGQEFAVIATHLFGIDRKPIPVSVYGLRYYREDMDELREEFEQTLDRFSVNYARNKQKGIYELAYGNKIRLMGLKSRNKIVVKAGMARTERDKYIIIIVEEAFEVKSQELQSFMEAVRGNSDTQILVIKICNPWSIKSDYVAFLNTHQKFDKLTLKKEGQQIALKDVMLEGGYLSKEIFHYTNWRVADREGKLSKDDVAGIMKAYQVDVKRAETADLGMPGYEGQAIYAYLLDKVADAMYVQHDRLLGGIDVGYGVSAKSGVTSAVILGFSDNTREIDVYSEWVHDNKINQIDPIVQVKMIVDWSTKAYQEYTLRSGRQIRSVQFRVDLSDCATISMLNSEAMYRGLRWLSFVPCIKQPIQDRVNIIKYAMSRKMLRISKSCKNLLKELEIIEWEKKKAGELKRENNNDHSINSFEYALEMVLYGIIRPEDAIEQNRMLKRKI